jgi:hypothetical protein
MFCQGVRKFEGGDAVIIQDGGAPGHGEPRKTRNSAGVMPVRLPFVHSAVG